MSPAPGPASPSLRSFSPLSWRTSATEFRGKLAKSGPLALSPVRASLLVASLESLGYDPEKTRFLEQGFKFGFRAGLSEPPRFRPYVSNPPSPSADSHARVCAHILGEVVAKRFLGPFLSPPSGHHWLHACASPLSEIPKKDPGAYRMVFNLSFEASDPLDVSVNDLIPKEAGFVRFPSFLDIALAILEVGLDKIFFALVDIKSAFRILPMHPLDWEALMLSWSFPPPPGSPSGTPPSRAWFIDICLCFGLRTGSALDDTLGVAISFLLASRLVKILRQLDDHLILGSSEPGCSRDLDTTLDLLLELGIPVAHKKTVLPTRCIKFKGYLWDALHDLVTLDPERWVRLCQEVRALMASSPFIHPSTGLLLDNPPSPLVGNRVSADTLRSTLGYLSWASEVFTYGRIFTGALFHALAAAGATSISPARARRIRLSLDREAISDLVWWRDLGLDYQANPFTCGRSISGIPPQGPNPTHPTHTIFTDASGSGLGAWLADSPEWMMLPFPSGLSLGSRAPAANQRAPSALTDGLSDPSPTAPAYPTLISSGFAEAAAILAALRTWAHLLKGGRVLIRSDSEVVVKAWSRKASSAPPIQRYLRAFAHECSKGHFSLDIVHIPGVENCIADTISRMQNSDKHKRLFRSLHPSAAPCASIPPSPQSIWLL